MTEPTRSPMHVVLCWHMHQPVYRLNGIDREPWTYLHGIKDYADMAAHLEAVPGARAVVNFSPVLLEHLEALSAETRDAVAAIDAGDIERACAALRDPLLVALLRMPEGDVERLDVLRRCLQVHPRTVLGRYPDFAALASLARPVLASPALVRHLAVSVFDDLLVWFHVGWFGEARRRVSPLLQRLAAQRTPFAASDRVQLLRLIASELGGLLPRYRALADSGQVELSTSPFAHPIVPLLLDLHAGREALPDSSVPDEAHYPSGIARARWHVESARAVFTRIFGRAPVGCWPSEGAVSRPTLELLADCGFGWVASGGAVLRNATRVPEADATAAPHCEHGSYALDGVALPLFFRDDGLSDAIGFNYQSWDAAQAVEDLVSHLLSIRVLCPSPHAVVPIILDGENAWEYYPENAYAFLHALYTRLSAHPELRLVTFSEHLRVAPAPAYRLQAMRAGSWVHGDLSTWVGNAARNRAWSMLVAAKRVFDAAELAPGARARADQLLAACECSDWFWWLSEHQNAAALARFDALYREHLRALYVFLEVAVPADVDVPLAVGSVDAEAALMLRAD